MNKMLTVSWKWYSSAAGFEPATCRIQNKRYTDWASQFTLCLSCYYANIELHALTAVCQNCDFSRQGALQLESDVTSELSDPDFLFVVHRSHLTICNFS